MVSRASLDSKKYNRTKNKIIYENFTIKRAGSKIRNPENLSQIWTPDPGGKKPNTVKY
jgi:hypothetical protein